VGGCGGLDDGDWTRKVARMGLDKVGLVARQNNYF